MSDNFNNTAEQAAAFQKIWVETMTKTMQSAFSMAPESAPPEVLQQIRSGIFQALAKSWEQFMRSPEFLERMKQWMETAVTFRQMTNDFLAKVRSDLQAPSRDDIDSVMLSVRHMEKRLLDRLEQLAEQVAQLNGHSRKKPRRNPRQAAAKVPRKETEKQTSAN